MSCRFQPLRFDLVHNIQSIWTVSTSPTSSVCSNEQMSSVQVSSIKAYHPLQTLNITVNIVKQTNGRMLGAFLCSVCSWYTTRRVLTAQSKGQSTEQVSSALQVHTILYHLWNWSHGHFMHVRKACRREGPQQWAHWSWHQPLQCTYTRHFQLQNIILSFCQTGLSVVPAVQNIVLDSTVCLRMQCTHIHTV